MPCYKEFPSQIKTFVKNFVHQNNFILVELRNDDYLRYSNHKWNVIFHCEYGVVEASVLNLEDGFQYNLGAIFTELFPESILLKEFSNNCYGSEKTIRFWINILMDTFPLLNTKYENLKTRLSKFKERSFILTDFTANSGSELLKATFSWNNEDWMELASKEYTTYRKEK